MLENISYTLIGAIIGTVIGSIGTWHVSRRLAFVERRQKQIEAACAELQDYRVVYAQYYDEYMSTEAEAAGRNWSKPIEHRPMLLTLRCNGASMAVVDGYGYIERF